MSQNKTNSPSQKRRERERKLRRNSIIETAEAFIFSQGLEQTMMEEVAREAGFSKATLYKYFPSKDDLYLGVAANAFKRLHQILENSLNNAEEGNELYTMVFSFLETVRENLSYAEIFDDKKLRSSLKLIMEKEEASEELTESQRKFRKYQQKSFAVLIRGISSSISKLEFKIDLSPLELANTFSTIVPGWIKELGIREKYGHQTKEQSNQQIQLILDIFKEGLKYYQS